MQGLCREVRNSAFLRYPRPVRFPGQSKLQRRLSYCFGTRRALPARGGVVWNRFSHLQCRGVRDVCHGHRQHGCRIYTGNWKATDQSDDCLAGQVSVSFLGPTDIAVCVGRRNAALSVGKGFDFAYHWRDLCCWSYIQGNGVLWNSCRCHDHGGSNDDNKHGRRSRRKEWRCPSRPNDV